MTAAQLFEAMMLVCFGVSWPVAIVRTWRARRVEGKSGLFLVLILVGYLAGIAAKFLRPAGAGGWPEPVTALYALNAVLVGIDLGLYLHFRK